MIKAAIFDMDGLLVDSEPLWRQVVAEAYKKLGIELTEEHHSIMGGQSTRENALYMHHRHQWKGQTPEELADAITAEVADRIKQGEVLLKPGVHQVLSVCKKAGLSVAIASAADQIVIDAVVDTLEIREHFHHIYSAQYEEYSKPHPGVFLQVARHFKVIPQDCLVFEDSPNGVLAAKAARMRCVAVPDYTPGSHPFIRTADVVLDSLEEFDEVLLERLNRQ